MNYHNYNQNSNLFWIVAIILGLLGGFKLIFAIVGLVLAIIINFLPLIIGGYIIYILFNRKKYQDSMGSYIKRRSESHQHFVELFVRTLCLVSQADGKVSDSEKTLIKQFFRQQLRFDSTQEQWVNDLIEHAIAQPSSVQDVCISLKSQFNLESLVLLTELLYQVALADGVYHQNEENIIQDIAQRLQIPAYEHERIRKLYLPQENKEHHHFAVLGLDPSASKDEIKKAYRRLSKEHHPDKVLHLGEEFQKLAEEKMVEINKAYQALY